MTIVEDLRQEAHAIRVEGGEQMHADLMAHAATILETQDRALRYCYEKLQPIALYTKWVNQWERKHGISSKTSKS